MVFELSSTFQPVRSIGVVPRLVTSNQSAPYGLSPLLHGEASVTATVSGERERGARRVRRGAHVVSSTATATLKLARSSGVPAFRYSAPPSISNSAASAPVRLSVLVPCASSVTTMSATFTRVAWTTTDAIGFVSVTAVGAWFGPPEPDGA